MRIKRGSFFFLDPAVLAAIVVTVSATTTTTTARQGSALFDWFLNHKGAYFDSARQAVVTTSNENNNNNNNNNSSLDHRLFAVASQDIEKGAVLAIIPTSVVLTPQDNDDDDDEEPWNAHFDCDTMYTVWKELSLGDDSEFAPYLHHLQHQSQKLPSQYSQAGKELFWDALTGERGIVLMEHAVHYEIWDYAHLCEATGTAKDQADFQVGAQGAMWVQQFALPKIHQHQHDSLIPLIDLYPHRNGIFTNVEIQVLNEDESNEHDAYARVVALRDIVQGERLHSSLNECRRCQQVLNARNEMDFGTPEIFRDHGFIEDYPQYWTIPETQNTVPYQDENGVERVLTMNGMDLVFRLEQNPNNALDIQVQWNFDEIEEHAYTAVELILLSRIRNLHRLKNIDFPLTAQDYNIPQDEWDEIWNFHQAYAMALKRAVIPIHDKIVAHGLSTMIQRPKDFGRSADNWDDHYTDFRVELDHIAYNDATCQSSEHTDFFAYQEYELEQSNYQEMQWQYRPKDDDTCLHLDGMLQICSSYRPHYHEFFVHYPARYLPEVKRVIFLGSGDAMLLHEILKYPSLEKVVGLELDQTVTRKSFKHFKTQPHYDDPRVEWWYGDATKTLPLLPRDYWGSFDLLLVDLSETVVSLHVTGKHDVLDVISMLLKPEGVMLENELYIDKMSRHFDHTVHIFYGSPKVCVQVHTVSSNSVDFLNSPIYDHGVDMFLIDKITEPQDRFKFIHDYVKTNPIAEGKCNSNGVEELASMIEHGRPAGILMVLEAEQCTTPLDDKNLAVLIYDVLRKQGLTPLPGPSVEQDGTIHIVLREGYLVARIWPLLHYVGFDIHLWGAFAKMESVRNGLATALGANMTSSYRVVVGGMHGSSTWEQDQASIGVQFSQKRNCTTPDRGILDLEPHTALRGALEESLSLLHVPRRLTVAVVCGSTDDCLTLTLLNDHTDVDNVIPFFPCHGVPEFNNGTKDFQPMYDCEREILERLTTLYNQEGLRIDAFVMDLTAPLSMLQIFASIWEDFDHRSQWLAERYVLAMPFTATETKRIRFMDLYRKLGHATVTSMAEFILQGKVGQSYLGWRVFTANDENAAYSLSEMTNNLQNRIPTANIQMRLLEGGQLHRPNDLELEERSFKPEDYDYSPNLLQMKEQRPLGRQTIFQFEKVPNVEMPSVQELQEALASSLTAMKYKTERLERWLDVGDGLVIMSIFSQGDVVLVWDGSGHLDINLFNLDEVRGLANGFQKHFLGAIHHRMIPTLRDDQPRGIGRVVNFQSDIDRDNIVMADIKRR